VIEHVAPATGQSASLAQPVPVWMLQWPGRVGQLLSLVQAVPEELQAPGTMGQSVSWWHPDEVRLQWPLSGQSPLTTQAPPSRLHAPGTVRHCVSFVQALWLIVHCPLTSGHCGSLKQPTWVIVHWPGCVGQLASL